MKYKNTILISITIIIFTTGFYGCIRKPLLDDNYVESYTYFTFRKMVSPSFYFDVLAFYKDGVGRADIYLKVGYDKLVFLKEEGSHIARYNCRIRILDEESDSILVDEEFEKTIVEKNWNENLSKYFDYSLKSYPLPRGSYVVSIKISDLNSTKYFSKLERVIINYSTDNPLQSSDLLLVQKVVNDQNGKSKITPIISKYISYLNEDTVFCFFELYNPEKIKVNIEMELTQVSYAAEKAEDFWQSYRQQYQSYSQPWQILSYQKIYSKNIEMELPPATNPFILPVPINHRSGTFLLHYKIKSSSGKDSIIKYIRFNILPEGFPKITSIDDQIAVSKLAGKIGERNFFPDSLSNDDKYKKLEEFWSQTNTWNKEEFFKRAELANERFTTFIEGWKTPMGIVYIVCGEPDNTDNNRWVYQENVFFDFLVLRDKGKYEIETPMVTLQGYSSNAYNFWYRSIDRIR